MNVGEIQMYYHYYPLTVFLNYDFNATSEVKTRALI